MMKNLLLALKTWSGSILKQLNTPKVEQPTEYSWMQIAQKEKGQAEIAGPKHNKRIVEYHQRTTLKAKDDETPWCSSFVNWCVGNAGYSVTGSAAARSWAKYGQSCKPHEGCIVVMTRIGGGHVGFYVRETAKYVYILGGNQSNKVSIAGYDKGRIIAYRLPSELNVPDAMVYDAKA
jgi:uncharacterized protein (TIGR02594 family)